MCKRWHHLVKSIYFEKVYLNGKNIQWLKRYLEASSESSSNTLKFEQLDMTKRLIIHSDIDYSSESNFGYSANLGTQFTEREFLYLLSRFPNLKCLDIRQSMHQAHYMKIFCNYQPIELPQLEEVIMESDDNDDYNDFYRVLKLEVFYQFRHSLKYMTAAYTNSIVREKKFMETLVDFKRLTVLEIYNDVNPDITLFHLLQACPALSILVYDSTFSVPDSAEQQLANMIKNLKDRQSSLSVFLTNLKKLKLSLPTFPTPYIDFFKTCTPENLDDIEMYLTDTCMRDWVFIETMNVALDFCKSLQKFTSITLKFDEDSVVEHQEIDSFYQILSSLTGNRKFHTRTAIHKDREEVNSTGVEIRITGSELYYEYCFDIEEYLAINGNDTKDSLHQTRDIITTPSASSLKQLAMVNKFSIWTEPNSHEYISIPNYYFEYANRFCFNITQFLFNCSFKTYVLEAKCPKNFPSLRHMTHIKMDGFYRPQDALNDLPKYFPNLEVLTFGLRSSFKSRHEKTVFKLKDFQCLHTLNISMEYIEHFKLGPIFLCYTNGEHHTTHYLLRITTKNGKIMNNNKFKRISVEDMEEGFNSNKLKSTHTYTINIADSHQVKRIILKNYDATYAELDLESNLEL